ncbi:hypothetical protein C2S52_021173 [Perilla frutescens var. hirtella]|nr:hypothetical protein C2S52_021173 [Perilla frutescens var. hirtella]KAH6808138.1 hypothetical protein C2S51_029246 [Perilla frutescens var. frutescens]
MQRLSSSDSLGGLMSICPNATEEGNNPMYMFEEEGCIEESGHVSEKKRRLGVDQVKALEKNFEVENKLEPDRKLKLAQELGLQPRQVAVWFQNRRARWKTKQLERDYGALKANYDALKLNFDRLQHDNQSLLQEILGLKSKLEENGSADEKMKTATEMENVIIVNGGKKEEMNWPKFGDLKDGSSDSDSSAILNEENNNSSGSPRDQHHQQLFDVGEIKESSSYQPQFVKIEEHNFFGEESCTTFFSDDQAPTLHQWYCNDEWN